MKKTGTTKFVSLGDAGRTVSADIGNGIAPVGQQCGGTVGPYNVQICAGGHRWIHY